MTVTEFLTKVSYALRGNDDDAPTFGTEEASYWVSILNRKKDELYQDARLQLDSAFNATAPNEIGTVATTGTTTLTGTGTYFTDYQVGDKVTVSGETVRTIATITSDTVLTVTAAFSNTASSKTFTRTTIIATGDQSYNLHRSFLYPSDQVVVTDTSSNLHYFDVVKSQERVTTTQQAYISGMNPLALNFTLTIASTDNIVGGTLAVPGFYLPDDVSSASDELPFTDPNWGVMSVASEIAFNDVVYEDKASDLNEKANALFKAMTQKNRSGTHGNARRVPYNNYRIGLRTNR